MIADRNQPIQRVCRYTLLLQELSKCTVNADCQSSHSEIKHVLDTVRTWASQIDSAAGNPIRVERIQRTIVLQRRLEIPALVSFSLPFLAVPLNEIYVGRFTGCISSAGSNGPMRSPSRYVSIAGAPHGYIYGLCSFRPLFSPCQTSRG